MTVEELRQKAIEHRKKYQQRPEGYNMDSSAEDGYIAGINSILDSDEYRLLVHEARQWRRHQGQITDKKEI